MDENQFDWTEHLPAVGPDGRDACERLSALTDAYATAAIDANYAESVVKSFIRQTFSEDQISRAKEKYAKKHPTKS